MIKQGEIYIVTINNTVGSEQEVVHRPCLIVQNNKGNEYSRTTIILPMTKKNKNKLPTHYVLKKKKYPFLEHDSLVLGEQIKTIDIQYCLEKRIGEISIDDLREIIKIISLNFT